MKHIKKFNESIDLRVSNNPVLVYFSDFITERLEFLFNIYQDILVEVEEITQIKLGDFDLLKYCREESYIIDLFNYEEMKSLLDTLVIGEGKIEISVKEFDSDGESIVDYLKYSFGNYKSFKYDSNTMTIDIREAVDLDQKRGWYPKLR